MQKYKLLRDGQIVGYERINGDITERSYENQVWVKDLDIPHDNKKAFLSFDTEHLIEVYED